jgi:hypothetical protein
VEAFDVDGPHNSRWHTVRCLDCGASSTTSVVPAKRLSPGSTEYAEAWRLDRTRIRRQLTTEAELLDPTQNPMHPRAEPDGPHYQGDDGRGERQHWPSFPSDNGRAGR